MNDDDDLSVNIFVNCYTFVINREGLTPAESVRLYSKELLGSGDPNDTSCVNPKKRAFYYQFKKLAKSANGDLGGDKMWDRVSKLEDEFPGIRVAYQRPSAAD